jgi:septation ring formation regulator EzrA
MKRLHYLSIHVTNPNIQSVLPLYFKLRTDPILTSDVDPQTASYVRFYHEKFQKDRPELLHQIKRATKTDQQSKDEVESLKHEVARLKESLSATAAQYDQKLADLSYECNRRITAMNAEYDKLAALVHNALASNANASIDTVTVTTPPMGPTAQPITQVPDLLHSLSQAAVTLQTHYHRPHHAPVTRTPPDLSQAMKRSGTEDSLTISPSLGPPLPSRPRFD